MSEAARSRARSTALASTRLIGALALLATGGIHLEQYLVADFRVVPTIGTLFLVNFVGGTILGLCLLIPARLFAGRIRRLADTIVAVAGCAVASGALAALLISEHTPLFGFMEHGYRLEIVIAMVAEAVAIVALGTFLALSYADCGARGRERPREGGINPAPPPAAPGSH